MNATTQVQSNNLCLIQDDQLQFVDGSGFWRTFGEYAATGGGALIEGAVGGPIGGFLGGGIAMAVYNGILGPESK